MPTFALTDLILLVLLSLTTWRIACDYTEEHGPFGLYYFVRTRLKRYAEVKIDASQVNDPKEHGWYWLYDGADCFLCVSFWLSGLLTLLTWTFLGLGTSAPPLLFFFHWGATAALAKLLDALFTRITRHGGNA